jgi:hypothetical protein
MSMERVWRKGDQQIHPNANRNTNTKIHGTHPKESGERREKDFA